MTKKEIKHLEEAMDICEKIKDEENHPADAIFQAEKAYEHLDSLIWFFRKEPTGRDSKN